MEQIRQITHFKKTYKPNGIEKYRIIAGMNQRELAKEMGVKQATISSWETGRTEPKAKQWILLADILEAAVSRVMGYEIR